MKRDYTLRINALNSPKMYYAASKYFNWPTTFVGDYRTYVIHRRNKEVFWIMVNLPKLEKDAKEAGVSASTMLENIITRIVEDVRGKIHRSANVEAHQLIELKLRDFIYRTFWWKFAKTMKRLEAHEPENVFLVRPYRSGDLIQYEGLPDMKKLWDDETDYFPYATKIRVNLPD